jgi:hypothetical protein
MNPTQTMRKPCARHRVIITARSRRLATASGSYRGHLDLPGCIIPVRGGASRYITRRGRAPYRRLGARYSQALLSGRRPASLPARKSQTKSQRKPASGDTQRRQATVKPGQVPTERHRATPGDTRNVTGGQGVAGSNPAVPTSNRLFSNILPLRKSQQKSQLVAQRPLHRPAPRAPRRPTRTRAKTAEQASSPVTAPKTTEPPGPAPRPRDTIPRPPADRRPDAHPGTAAAGRGQLRVLKPGLPTPP